jgi:hypothetical protein
MVEVQHQVAVAFGIEDRRQMRTQVGDEAVVGRVAADEIALRGVHEYRAGTCRVVDEHHARHRAGQDRLRAQLVIEPGEQARGRAVRGRGESSEQSAS